MPEVLLFIYFLLLRKKKSHQIFLGVG